MNSKLVLLSLLIILFVLSIGSCVNGGGSTTPQSSTTTQSSPGSLSTSPDPSKRPEEENEGDLVKEFLVLLNNKNAADVASLVKKGFDPNKEITVQHFGSSKRLPPLHCMILGYCSYDKGVLSALVKHGADINKKFTYKPLLINDTPLFAAVNNENVNAVRDLLDLGADPNIMSDSAPLHVAVEKFLYGKNYLEIITLLLNDPRINLQQKDQESHTPLYYTAYSHYGELSAKAKNAMKPVVDAFAAKGVTIFE